MAIKEYFDELRINNIKESTIKYYGYILNAANEYKDIDTWNKEDVNKFLLSLSGKNKKSTIEIKKMLLKEYFIWLGKQEIVSHLHVDIPQNKLKREEILTTEDINKMIDITISPMFKALIVLLFESGARISEVIALTVDDIQDTNEGMIISVKSEKTDGNYRRSIYPLSSQYIRNYISYSGLKKGDKLFPITTTWSNIMIKRIAKEAGITKPVTCHKFRHAQATDMVIRGYQEGIIRKKLGWTNNSNMISRYTHLVDEDVIDATLEKNGQEVRKHPITNVNQAEPLNIIDAGMQLSKLSEENEDLKVKVEGAGTQLLKLSEENEWLKSNMINMKNMMSYYEQELLELKEGLKTRKSKS
jgi:integrase/recombinase XerD